jgi:pilus assembly protein FimV
MGILDEAIREHLELKRQHGADDSELKQLEDQAFGQSERPGAEGASEAGGAGPDPAAEAPTEFMAQPDVGDGEPQGRPSEDAVNQEPPPVRREPAAGVADIQEAPAKAEEPEDRPAAEEPPAEKEPVAEEQPAAEHEAIPDTQSGPASHSTEERHAIADQPTQMYDIEEEFASTEAPAPPDEDLVAEEMTEARLGPAEPLPPASDASVEDDEDDDFFDEQRLSDELDQALEAPLDPEPAFEEEAEPIAQDPEPIAEAEPAVTHTEEHEAPAGGKADSDEDVLEETPDFLEETPEDDELWFEQKPPKDFDFDD